jgi:hypothetical protein
MPISVAETIEQYLAALPEPHRRLSEIEWGFTVEAAGWQLDVGIAIRDGLFRVQAPVCEADKIAEGTLLWWNRRLPLVRFAATQAGEVWLCCDLPISSVDQRQLDRTLGLFVLTATQARQQAYLPTGNPS